MTTSHISNQRPAPLYYEINYYSGKLQQWSLSKISSCKCAQVPIGIASLALSVVCRVVEACFMSIANLFLRIKYLICGMPIKIQPMIPRQMSPSAPREPPLATEQNFTDLEWAAIWREPLEISILLSERKFTTEQIAWVLQMAVRNRNIEVLRALLKDRDISVVYAMTPGGLNPICEAALCKNSEAIKLFASLGANMNMPNGNGLTPMYYAILMGSNQLEREIETVKALLQHKASVFCNVPDGKTLLQTYINNWGYIIDLDLVELLASEGIDPPTLCPFIIIKNRHSGKTENIENPMANKIWAAYQRGALIRKQRQTALADALPLPTFPKDLKSLIAQYV